MSWVSHASTAKVIIYKQSNTFVIHQRQNKRALDAVLVTYCWKIHKGSEKENRNASAHRRAKRATPAQPVRSLTRLMMKGRCLRSLFHSLSLIWCTLQEKFNQVAYLKLLIPKFYLFFFLILKIYLLSIVNQIKYELLTRFTVSLIIIINKSLSASKFWHTFQIYLL